MYLYVCGLCGFMDVVLNVVCECGWGEMWLYYEFFGGVVVLFGVDCVFQVWIVSSGKVIDVLVECMVIVVLVVYGVDVLMLCE